MDLVNLYNKNKSQHLQNVNISKWLRFYISCSFWECIKLPLEFIRGNM
jgi:hypothetical protein